MLQAAWIVEDTDDDSDEDQSDGMILEERQNDSSGHKENTFSDFDEDRASLSLSMRDFDGETEADTAMTVSLKFSI